MRTEYSRWVRSQHGSRMSALQGVLEQEDFTRMKAERECSKLVDLIGENNYRLWAEITWPGISIQKCTWSEILETAHEAIWLGKYALLSELECTCKDGDLCKVCRAWARVVA